MMRLMQNQERQRQFLDHPLQQLAQQQPAQLPALEHSAWKAC